MKLLFIGGLVLLLQIPVHLIHELELDRKATREKLVPAAMRVETRQAGAFESYRVVERAMNYDLLVAALVLTTFFLFEALVGLRLHAVHYGLVGAALCLFYLALLALGEFVGPDAAYAGAAIASSLLIVFYSAAILRRWERAGLVGGLLAGVYGLLYLVLRMEDYALLAGTGALFAALAAVMFLTRNVDWDNDAPGAAPAR
jgi:inner membrane protein